MLKSKIIILALAAALCSACGTKAPRTYQLNCPLADGHPSCGQEYDSFAECNNARLAHDRDVSRDGKYPATCY